jgi:acyl-CoA thioesterase FadM
VISFAAAVQIHIPLLLKTYGIGFTRITAQRGYGASLADERSDDPIILARTLWVYVDVRGRPMCLPEVPLPACPESQPATTACVVRFSDIDPMRHLNNAAAVEMLDNAGWEACGADGITPETTRLDLLDYELDYLDSPRFGERLTIQSWHDPFPAPGQAYTRFQQMVRGGSVMVRIRSRWLCRAEGE